MSRPAHTFPFSAIVGQDVLKTALLLNAVDSRVGGVLIRGEKGTAKSTAVRALASILPVIDVVEGCRFGCDPAEPQTWCVECRERRQSGPLPKTQRRPSIVNLPVSATEDRLVGTLSLEKALKHGERHFEPGLLAAANRGILYVDEVNLLDDHLVDTLLDAAAMGVNSVEREGISFLHPARFILVGTMNPEEGEIRPQLLDRFGLCVDVEGVREPEARVEIVRRRHEFEEDPTGFARGWADREAQLETSLKHSRVRRTAIQAGVEILYGVASIAIAAGVDGHRADGVMVRAASALAALDGRTEVNFEDVERIAPLVLAHRMKRGPFDEPRLSVESIRQLVSEALAASDPGSSEEGGSGAPGVGDGQVTLWEAQPEGSAAPTDPTPVDAQIEAPLDRTRRSMAGKRQETVSDDRRGRYVRSQSPRPGAPVDFALDASVRAAAPKQGERDTDLAIAIEPEDVRTKVRTRKVGASIVFCVDASGSMGAAKRMDAAKAAVLDLLKDAYTRRDRVGLVSFRGERADIVLAPTASVELAHLKLKSLPTGGSTPLALGMLRAIDLLENEARRNPDVVPWMVLVTDGRANVGLDGGLGSEDARAVATRMKGLNMHAVVIDTSATANMSAAREIARAAGAEYVRLASLDGATVADTVRSRL